MGFSLNRHYCLGTIVDETWYYVSNDCKPEHKDQEGNCRESADYFGSCCTDQWLSVSGLSINSLPQENKLSRRNKLKVIAATFSSVTAQSSLNTVRKVAANPLKNPPLLLKEIIIEYQRLLI